MLSSFNVQGNLGRDAETRYTPNGVCVVNFSIANSQKYKGETKTNWFRVSYFGKGAEAIAPVS